MSGLLACAALVLATLLTPALAWGDGGALIFREERGSLVVTLLAEPTPLRAGMATFDILVQSLEMEDPVLSADVHLRLVGPDAGDVLEVAAGAGVAANRLFRAVEVELPDPGQWQIDVLVVGPESGETFHAQLHVAPPLRPLRRYRSYIAATLVALALLALHQALSLSGPRPRVT